MTEKIYRAKVRFTLEGIVDVPAESRNEAKYIIEQLFGMDAPNILSACDGIKYTFPIHPTKKVSALIIRKEEE